VQTLLVAFSRRMCCSRVCRDRRRAGRPRESLDTPTMRHRHVAFIFFPRREIGRVRPAVAERYAKTLRAADGDVRSEFTRRTQQCKAQQVCSHRHENIRRVRLRDKSFVIMNVAVGAGILHERAKDLFIELEGLVVADLDLNAERFGAGFDDIDGLGVAFDPRRRKYFCRAGDSWHMCMASAAAVASSSSEALAMARPVRSLTMVWKFNSASNRPWEISADMACIGVQARIFQNVPLNHRRRDAVGITHADERTEHLVFARRWP